MKLIVGLGNPGKKYEGTRHNVGFDALDKMTTVSYSNCVWKSDSRSQSKICPVPNSDLLLVKPQTYMNKSGEAVSSLAAYYKIPPANIFVIHDDLDIKLGEYKIQPGKGPKDHKGIQSISERLGTKDFYRVRIGVENRSDKNISGDDYILMQFAKDEREIVDDVIKKAIGELVHTVSTT